MTGKVLLMYGVIMAILLAALIEYGRNRYNFERHPDMIRANKIVAQECATTPERCDVAVRAANRIWWMLRQQQRVKEELGR